MKSLLLSSLVLILFLGNKESDSKQIYDLDEAIELKLISSSINARTESPHYAKPASISIKNLTNKPVNVRIPNGQQLVSHPADVQDLIVVNEELIMLAGNGKRKVNLYAMCTQHSNRAPNNESYYSLGGIAKGPLRKLTREIQNRRDYNTLGQYAVWTIANDRDLSTITGHDEKSAIHYQEFVSNLTGRPVPEPDPDDYLTNYNNSSLIKRSIGGNFEYSFSRESSVTIGMFNEQDIIVRELFNKPEVKPGKHKLNFEFDALAYTDSLYYIRLIINGNIRLESKMAML